MKLIVTGCARSGTCFFHILLNKLGIPATHEKIFDPKVWDGLSFPHDLYKSTAVEVAWEAAPYLLQLPMEYTIIHLVRSPVKQMSSLKHLGFFENEKHPGSVWVRYAQNMLWTLKEGSYIERYMKYWVLWNKMIEECQAYGYNYHRIDIEKIDAYRLATILLKAGKEIKPDLIEKRLKSMPKNINSVGRPKGLINWESLPSGSLGFEMKAMADRYGLEVIE